MQVILDLFVEMVDRKKCLFPIQQLLIVLTYFPYLQSSSGFFFFFFNHNLRVEDIRLDFFVCLCLHPIFP